MSDSLTTEPDSPPLPGLPTPRPEQAKVSAQNAKTDAPKGDPSWDRLINLTLEGIDKHDAVESKLGNISSRFSDLSSEISSRKLPEPPPAPELTPPPVANIDTGFQNFGSAASALGIFGALLTRRPLTTALNASAKAMNSLHNGQVQEYKLAFDQWEANTAYTLKVSKIAQDRYQSIMENQKTSDDQKLNLLKAEAALLKDQNLINVARTGDIKAVSDMIYRRDLIRANLEKAYASVKPENMVLQRLVEEWREAHDGQDPPAAELAKMLQSVRQQDRSAISALYRQWKADPQNAEKGFDEFSAYYRDLRGTISFEQRKALEELKADAALLRTETANNRDDPDTKLLKNIQKQNPEWSWQQVSDAFIRIKGRHTPESRQALQSMKDTAARERAMIIATGGGAEGVPKKTVEKAVERIEPGVDVLQRLDEGIQGIIEHPNAIGPMGATVDALGGLLQFAEKMAGARGAVSGPMQVDEVRRVRSTLQNTVGPLIPSITGDKSGRYSDKDRRIADEAFNALNFATSEEQAFISLSIIRDITSRGLLHDIRIAGPQGQAMLKAMNVNQDSIEKNRFATLVGKDGEYEYDKVWYDKGELWARKSDGQVGKLKWR